MNSPNPAYALSVFRLTQPYDKSSLDVELDYLRDRVRANRSFRLLLSVLDESLSAYPAARREGQGNMFGELQP